MKIRIVINGQEQRWEAAPHESLLTVLRREGNFSVKHGCETGECGACAALVDGRLRPTCVTLAAQADGHQVTTVESLGSPLKLHPIQEAFLDTGAVQCGYCTPAMMLATQRLLEQNPSPTEDEVRECLSGVLCRCTGYVKPVEAVLRAAALLRGEEVAPIERSARGPLTPDGRPWDGHGGDLSGDPRDSTPPAPGGVPGEAGPGGDPRREAAPVATLDAITEATLETHEPLRSVGSAARKVDGPKLAAGKPAFTDDFEIRGLLYGKLLLSPHAHARIKRIDASRARALPGVHAVLTHEDIPRVSYTTAGQSWPEPSPYDMRSLDDKVRYVGDRVAAIAAESPEIAEAAARLIEVEYEVLPAALDPRQSMAPGAPVIHDEPDARGFAHHDFSRNLAGRIEAGHGDLEAAMAEADLVIEGTYEVPKVQQVSIEPHITITFWDEDGRMVVRTSTQVPFHVRRIIAPLIGLPPGRIRVIKPRIGGGFGGKQEVLIEDICAHLTVATGRPVKLEYSRAEEFMAARSRHPQILRMRTGVMRDGTVVANEMYVVADTGAYGCHAITVQSNTGVKTIPLYRAKALRFTCDTVYTNLPPAGAFRGYGVPQGAFALECHMDVVAEALGMDPMEFRAKNHVRVGDVNVLSKKMNEGKEGYSQVIYSCGLTECIAICQEAIGYREKREKYGARAHGGKLPVKVRGVGGAISMQGSAIPGVDMGGAVIKINDDGTFNLMIGATDIGTGADTVLAQIAAEALGITAQDIMVYPSDTDLTPFDTGAYASSTTYISGMAAKKAAEEAAWEMRKVAAKLLGHVSAEHVMLRDKRCWAPDGRSVSHQDVSLHSLHVSEQQQIMGHASAVSLKSPPPFAAEFAEVEVDTETGEVRVLSMVAAVDCGRAINPILAEGQIEGAITQSLGYATTEEMVWDESGHMITRDLRDYKIYEANEMPRSQVFLVETHEPYGPYGAKAVAEVPINPLAPAIANAVAHALGIRINQIPLTPERVLRAIRAAQGQGAPAADQG